VVASWPFKVRAARSVARPRSIDCREPYISSVASAYDALASPSYPWIFNKVGEGEDHAR
jgi:hypothetical protein